MLNAMAVGQSCARTHYHSMWGACFGVDSATRGRKLCFSAGLVEMAKENTEES
jgi:hypothetical protein